MSSAGSFRPRPAGASGTEYGVASAPVRPQVPDQDMPSPKRRGRPPLPPAGHQPGGGTIKPPALLAELLVRIAFSRRK